MLIQHMAGKKAFDIWAIEGCLLLQAAGLNAPESVAASITAYRSEMDTVAGFIEDECHEEPVQKSSVASLYEQYASYCKSHDKHSRTKVQFGNALKSQGYAQVPDSTGRY
jgi:putative DNA primase/helicase